MRHREIFNKTIQRAEGTGKWYLLLYSVAASVSLTGVIASVMSILFHGRITADYLITGAVAASFVSAIVVYMLLSITGHIRRYSEKAVSAEENYHAIFDSIRDCVCILSPEGRFLNVNRTMCEINEAQTPDELIGKSCLELIADNTYAMENSVKRAAQGETVDIGYKSITKSGKELWWDSRLTPIRDSDGSVKGILGIGRETTKRKAMEDELKKRFNQIQALYAIVSVLSRSDSLNEIFDETLNAILVFTGVKGSSILLFDSDGVMRFTAWKGISDSYRKAVEGHSPWQPDEPNPLPIVIEDTEKDASLKSLHSVILNEGLRSMVFIPLTAGGRLMGKLMLYYGSPRQFSEDDLRFFQSVAHHLSLSIERRMKDEKLVQTIKGLEQTRSASLNIMEDLQREIFNRGKAEDALKEKTLQLENLLKDLKLRVEEEVEKRMEKEQLLIHQSKLAAMGEMIGAIAHQWRQPLNALGLIVQDIKDAHEFGELNKDYIDKSVNKSMVQINMMSKTIDDFRNFFMSGKKKEPFDTMQEAGEVLSLMSAQLRAKNIHYRLACHTHGKTFYDVKEIILCEAKTITGYKNEFKHVILNLIDNAKDAIAHRIETGLMPKDEEGMIGLDFYNANEKAIIKISDNGGGIPEEIKDRIFEPYFTTKEQGQGTGIGLYMAKMIIEDNMGGRLYAENIKDGAMFTIELNEILPDKGN